MALETRLAAAHWDKVRCRDVVATYNLATLEVRDEGRGMDLAVLARAFTLFGQGERSLAATEGRIQLALRNTLDGDEGSGSGRSIRNAKISGRCCVPIRSTSA